ncbi:MAG: nucleotidyltransferase domain-containing protein, partial [Anaerolineales bacterium]
QRSVRDWAERQVRSRTDILRIGYFGSYARGDWGVGSDLDVILIVEQCEQPFWKRSLDWNLASMPVPVDLLVYTRQEWQTLAAQKGKFYQMVMREAV